MTGQKFGFLLSHYSIWFLFLAALCLMVPRSLSAGEPILTLAMARVDSSSRHQYQLPKDRAETSPDPAPNVSTPHPPKPVALDDNFPRVTLSLAKQQGPRPANPVLQTGKYLTERGHSRFWQHVQAGYGEVFVYKATGICSRNVEEPSCGYLKFCFPF